MKKHFTFLIAAALMLLTMMATTGTMWGQTTDDLDFSFSNIGSTGWTNSYAQHVVEFDNATVTFASASKQTGTITNYPVTKGQPVSVVLNESTNNITSVTFTCVQWGTKVQTITLHYSTNGGTSYTSTGITSNNFTISSNNLPEGTNAVKITFSSTSNQVGIGSCSVTFESGSSSSLEDSDLALENAPIALEFDLYNNSNAQVINYSTSSTGAVTVSESEFIETEVNEATKTITVTPIAVTSTAQTITVSQVADDNYKAGSQTFTVSITDSTPFAGGDVIFVAGTDIGNSTGQNPDEITKSCVTISSTSAALASQQYRFYKNSVTTISTTSGKITQIVFTHCDNSYPVSNLSNLTDGTWTGEAESVQFTASAQARASQIVVTVAAPTSNPYITAVNVDIDYDVTGGNITYTINNEPNPAGSLTAAIKDGTTPTIANFSLGSITGEAVPFTCGANTESTAHTAEVTLTYTYNTNETVTKDVTITQAADPNATMTIAEVREQATGSVATKGIVTSCVGTTGYIQDATAAICVYGSSLTVGDEIRVSGTLSNYNGLLEITSPEVTVLSSGNTINPVLMTIAEAVASTNQGWYIRIEEATVTEISGQNTTISQGDNTIVVRGISGVTVAVNDVISLNGNIGCYNINQIANPQNIEVQQPTEPTITVIQATVNAPFIGDNGTIDVTYSSFESFDDIEPEAQFFASDGETSATYDWITVTFNDDKDAVYTVDANDGEARTAYFKVYEQSEGIYSNLVTVIQEEYVAPTYAELPFSFDGGKADIEDTDGLSQEGLGGDYGSSPKLKFDGTGDWLLLQFDERPGTLTFDIKGNTFSGGTFTVQTSEDGETYTDLTTYTELGSTQSESFNNLGENVRYIKWIYTEKVNGNVALGNIALAAYQEQVATPTFSPAEGEYNEAQSVTIACATEGATIYYKTAENAEWAIYSEAINVAETTTIWAYAAKEGMNNSAVATATYTINIPILTASITVYPLNIEATAAETVDWLAITLENIDITEDGGGEFDLVFCDNDGNPLSEKPAWFEFDFSFNDVWSMPYTILANTETTARTLYFKIYGLGDDGETEAYSDLVTVTQAGYVVDYAELPFEWDGGTTADFNALTGTSTNGVGDYAESHGVYRMKLDSDGDYIMVKTNSQPGIVTIGVKMIGGGNTSTITVQGSADGESFTDIEELTISGNQNDVLNLETTNDFATTDRYVKLLFTKGSNVGVGPIMIAQVDNTPAITLSSYEIDVTAEGGDGTLTVTYKNIETDLGASIYWFESDSETPATEPDWISADINETTLNVDYIIGENDGEARTAYFKVCGSDSETNLVYSELVTVTQDAYIPPVPTTTYTLATSIESGLHYIITNGTNKAMGVQNNNNRAAVAITIENYATTITEDAGVYEIVINGPDANGKYTIYDKQYPGYLYAASSSSNHLKTRESNSDGDSQWTIEFETEGNVIITATGNNTRNLMRYNNGSTCFSCYDTNNSQQNIYLYVKENDTDYEYYGTEINYTATSVPDGGSLTVGDGTVMTVPNNFENTDPTALIIEDGGQLIHTADVEATVQKSVSGYTNKSGNGWYLIASPVDNYSTSTIATGTYDLFIYNEPNAYWYSSTGAAAPFNTLERGKGYLYANAANVNLNYAGTMKATNANITVDLSFECDAYPDLRGFNLMGNPFSRNLGEGDMTVGSTAVTMYYGFDDAREEFETKTIASTPIKPGQGFFIQATEAGQQLVFNPATSKDASDFKYISISAGDENFTDKAYIQFGYGNTLRKMTFGENTMVYVMNDDLDYAAARVEELAGTMPVHFVPIEDGFYTITVETKNIENLNYMHLIDNIKNTEIDLLVEPSYTFKASESDNADRFYLVFDFNNYTGVNENYTNDNFAHQIGDEIFVSGEGTLQVFDVLGRFVTGYNVNGDKRISTAEFNTGVYIFRMVGTEVKTQKIIVR